MVVPCMGGREGWRKASRDAKRGEEKVEKDREVNLAD